MYGDPVRNSLFQNVVNFKWLSIKTMANLHWTFVVFRLDLEVQLQLQ